MHEPEILDDETLKQIAEDVRVLIGNAVEARGDDCRTTLISHACFKIDRLKSDLLNRYLRLHGLRSVDEKEREQVALTIWERVVDDFDARVLELLEEGPPTMRTRARAAARVGHA